MSYKILTSKMIATLALLFLAVLLFGCNQGDDKASSNDQVKTFNVAKKNNVERPADIEETSKAPSVPAIAGVTTDTAPEVISEKASEEMLYGKPLYDPVGKIDPFEPLFSKRASASPDAVGQKDLRPTTRQTRLARLTPLEKLDISQLRLVGIVKASERNMGMVQEAGGKGYVIRKGTYIGVNSGQVIEIENGRVLIEEEVENFLGKIVIRTRELKLQKPLGEE